MLKSHPTDGVLWPGESPRSHDCATKWEETLMLKLVRRGMECGSPSVETETIVLVMERA